MVRNISYLILACVALVVIAQSAVAWHYASHGGRQIVAALSVLAAATVIIAGFVLLRKFDEVQATTIPRADLDKTVQERTRELEAEIKARRASEAELRAGERYLAIILNSIADGVLITNAAGCILRMNPVAEQLTGWKTVQAVGKPIDEVFRVIDGQTRQLVPTPVDEVIAENRIIDQFGQAILVHRDGAECPIANTCSPIRDQSGYVLGTIVVFRDVTDARNAEEKIVKQYREVVEHVASRTTELRESERRHSTLLANLQGMAFRCHNNRDWTMEFVSDGCRNLLGVEPADLTRDSARFNELIHSEDREKVWNEVQSAIAEQSAFAVEYRVKHAAGQWRAVLMQGRPIPDGQKQIAALEGYITDMTWRVDAERERRVLEDQVRSAQKMEAIGTLAGGVAHDFNNVLTAILGSAELMKMDLTPEHPSWELLEQIFLAGKRAREVVQQILTFSQRRESERSIVRLQPLVKECVKLLRSTIPAMVEISCQMDPDCAPVLADPTQIHQVIMNLCTNAWQALPKNSGYIRVSLEMCDIDESLVARHPGLPAGPAVRLSICDNGSGIDKATRERIFEPFFTTKPVGEGSGLGLSVVHGIVKSHHGVITVDSEPGKGTVFHVYFPPQAEEEDEAPSEAETVSCGNNERILFVDDDELAGRTTEKILGRLGYRVTWFKAPADALAQFRERPFDFDLVVTDFAMAGMTGEELAASVLRVRADIPILITTGLIDPVMLKQAREMGVHNVLLKPVSATTLAREIARGLVARGELSQSGQGQGD